MERGVGVVVEGVVEGMVGVVAVGGVVIGGGVVAVGVVVCVCARVCVCVGQHLTREAQTHAVTDCKLDTKRKTFNKANPNDLLNR